MRVPGARSVVGGRGLKVRGQESGARNQEPVVRMTRALSRSFKAVAVLARWKLEDRKSVV